jgi:hypothetical protein
MWNETNGLPGPGRSWRGCGQSASFRSLRCWLRSRYLLRVRGPVMASPLTWAHASERTAGPFFLERIGPAARAPCLRAGAILGKHWFGPSAGNPAARCDPCAALQAMRLCRVFCPSARVLLPPLFELRSHIPHICLQVVPILADHVPVHHRRLAAGRRRRQSLTARPLIVS